MPTPLTLIDDTFEAASGARDALSVATRFGGCPPA
jgi:hypothetical protein